MFTHTTAIESITQHHIMTLPQGITIPHYHTITSLHHTTPHHTTNRDGTNNFNAMRPWTVAQVVGLEDAQKVRPQWFTAWQELRCLQYVHKRTGDHTVVQRMDDGKKVSWGCFAKRGVGVARGGGCVAREGGAGRGVVVCVGGVGVDYTYTCDARILLLLLLLLLLIIFIILTIIQQVGPADKDLIPDESFDRFVDAAFWDHFDKAEGPLLMVSPY